MVALTVIAMFLSQHVDQILYLVLAIFAVFPLKFLIDILKLKLQKRTGFKLTFDKGKAILELNNNPIASIENIYQVVIVQIQYSDGDENGYKLKMKVNKGKSILINKCYHREEIIEVAELIASFLHKPLRIIQE